MEIQLEVLSLVRRAAKKKILFLPHAVRQMSFIFPILNNGKIILERGKKNEMHAL